MPVPASSSMPVVLRARWIFPTAGEPIADGAIEIGADGRIIALHRRAPPGAQDMGDVAIVPGFVNAHTHLEFSDLDAPLGPALPFSAWIRSLVECRRLRGDSAAAIARGLEECRRNGTVAVGEISTRDWSELLGNLEGPRMVMFREIIGVAPDQAASQLETASAFLDQAAKLSSVDFMAGLSPHSPYSVGPPLFEQLVELAAARGVPVTIHLAETPAELELLAAGTGELAQLLRDLGAWREGVFSRGTRPLDLLRTLSRVGRVIIAHGNYLDAEEIEFIAQRRNMAVVYCPRTHAYFGHDDHPCRKLQNRGALVAIGTDGRCSNPDLSVWNELRFLHEHFPATDPALLLRMGTLNGARALGLDSVFGTLEPGKSGQVAVLTLGDSRARDPYDALFHPDSRVEQWTRERVV